MKVPQGYFDSTNCPNQIGMQASKYLFALVNKLKKLI